jgi:hypothetical protein
MGRQAEPLDPKALSVWHDACIEEINQGNEHWGLSCLLATHSGFRERIVGHYTDRWRIESSNETDQKFSLPEGQTACTLEPDGCYHCHQDKYSCDDGFFMVKKDTEGVGRELPLWNEWIDYYRDEVRPTHLSKWLNHYFMNNDSFGFAPSHLGKVVNEVAKRRHETIADQHEGEVERRVTTGEREVVPWVKPHDLRATWATQCLRAGVDDEQLMDWAGWNTRQMIDRYRDKLNDPSGENTKRYARGRGGEELAPAEKIAKMQEWGVLEDGENVSAEKLAKLESLL